MSNTTTKQCVYDTVTLLLSKSVTFHLFHFNAKTHAEHLVLKGLYELCRDSADSLAEEALGLYPGLFDQSYRVSYPEHFFGEPNDTVDELLSTLTSLALCGDIDPILASSVQDIVSRFRQQKYLLNLAYQTTVVPPLEAS